MSKEEAPRPRPRVTEQPVKDAITYRAEAPDAEPDPAIDPHAAKKQEAVPAAPQDAPAPEADEASADSKPARKTAKAKE